MRRVKIDFTAGCPVTQEYAGEIGESRAVELEIIPEKEMLEDEDIVLYCCVFEVEGGVYMSAFTSAGEDILIPLDIVLTEQRVLKGQLLGQNADGTILAKSPVFRLFLGKSIEGEIIPDPETGDSIYAQLAKAILAMENKVDKIEGKGLSTEDYTTEEKAKLSGIPEPTVADYDKVLKVNSEGEYELEVNADGGAIEITDELSVNVSRFTPNEIIEMFNAGQYLTYRASPIVAAKSVNNTVVCYYIADTGALLTVLGFVVSTEKTISFISPTANLMTSAEKDKLAGIEEGAVKVTEIWESGNLAKYTKSQIEIMASQKKPLCYQGHPVLLARSEEDGSKINLYYLTSTDGTPKWKPIVYRISVDAQKNIVLDVPGNNLFSGNYNDLTNLPTLGAVATSNDYNDLNNKPTIPTVPTNVSAFTNDAGYLTQHQDISGKEDKTNKVTAISSASTDNQYPSAKCVYDNFGDCQTAIDTLNSYISLELTAVIGGSY